MKYGDRDGTSLEVAFTHLCVGWIMFRRNRQSDLVRMIIRETKRDMLGNVRGIVKLRLWLWFLWFDIWN